MDPVTLYRLGQLRHAEILEQVERERQPRLRIRAAAAAPMGRLLLAWSARLVGSSGCAKVFTGDFSITICSAQST